MSRATHQREQPQRTDARVQDEDGHVRAHRRADLHHLREELRLLAVAPGRVHDDDLEALLAELRDPLRGERDGVRLSVRPEVRDLRLRRGLPRLVECARAERVCADDRSAEATLLVVHGELRARRRLAVTLAQWNEHRSGDGRREPETVPGGQRP